MAPERYFIGRSPRGGVAEWRPLHQLYWSLHSYGWGAFLRTPESREITEAIVGWLSDHAGPKRRALLDLGCGTGDRALALAKAGFQVLGIDFSPGMIRQARARATDAAPGSMRFDRADFDARLPFADRRFDQVICVEALHGSTNPTRVLHEARRVLRADGLFLIVAVGTERHRRHRGTLSGLLLRGQRSLGGWRSRVRTVARTELLGLVIDAGFRPIREHVLAGELLLLARAPTAGDTTL